MSLDVKWMHLLPPIVWTHVVRTWCRLAGAQQRWALPPCEHLKHAAGSSTAVTSMHALVPLLHADMALRRDLYEQADRARLESSVEKVRVLIWLESRGEVIGEQAQPPARRAAHSPSGWLTHRYGYGGTKQLQPARTQPVWLSTLC